MSDVEQVPPTKILSLISSTHTVIKDLYNIHVHYIRMSIPRYLGINVEDHVEFITNQITGHFYRRPW